MRIRSLCALVFLCGCRPTLYHSYIYHEKSPAIEILCSAMSEDGTKVYLGCSDGTVKVWDVSSSTQMKILSGHAGKVTCMAVSGNTMVTGGEDGTVRFWDIATEKELSSHNAGTVNSVAIDSNCSFMAAAGGDKIFLWDSRKAGPPLEIACRAVSGIGFIGQDHILLSCSSDGALQRWEAYSGELIDTHTDGVVGFKSLSVSRDGKIAVVANSNCSIGIWDADKMRKLETKKGEYLVDREFWIDRDYQISAVCTTTLPIGDGILWGDEKGQLGAGRPSSLNEVNSEHMKSGGTGCIYSIAASSDYFISTGKDGVVDFWKTSDRNYPQLAENRARMIVWPDGEWVFFDSKNKFDCSPKGIEDAQLVDATSEGSVTHPLKEVAEKNRVKGHAQKLLSGK